MAKQHERANVSLHQYTLGQVQDRVLSTNVSHVIDRDLTRYYSMLEVNKSVIDDAFTPTELKDLAKAVFNAPLSRNLSLNMLRMHLMSLYQHKGITQALAEQIQRLDDAQFLALLDRLEHFRPKPRR